LTLWFEALIISETTIIRSNTMGNECRFSFDDLFHAATGRDMTAEEKDRLYTLPQEARNAWVQGMVQQTNGSFEMDAFPRQGSDGQGYIAFWGAGINAQGYMRQGVPLDGGGDTHFHPFGNGRDAYKVTTAIPIGGGIGTLKIYEDGSFNIVD
jgi:hypothetical protein